MPQTRADASRRTALAARKERERIERSRPSFADELDREVRLIQNHIDKRAEAGWRDALVSVVPLTDKMIKTLVKKFKQQGYQVHFVGDGESPHLGFDW